MKKFLSKLATMITLLSLAVIGLLFYVVMLVRPVSYGMTYSYTKTLNAEEAAVEGVAEGTEQTLEITIKNDTKAKMKMISNGKVQDDFEIWIIRNGNKIALILNELTDEEYNAAVEELKKDTEYSNEFWNEGNIMPFFEINSFMMSPYGIPSTSEIMTLICNNEIIFASIFGVVEIALITFGIFSIIFYKKNKNNINQTSQEIVNS